MASLAIPYIFNGFEQNSQFISPTEPVTKPDLIPATENAEMKVSSLEGYGAPIIDLSMWFMDSVVKSVVGTLHNFCTLSYLDEWRAHTHQY